MGIHHDLRYTSSTDSDNVLFTVTDSKGMVETYFKLITVFIFTEYILIFHRYTLSFKFQENKIIKFKL